MNNQNTLAPQNMKFILISLCIYLTAAANIKDDKKHDKRGYVDFTLHGGHGFNYHDKMKAHGVERKIPGPYIVDHKMHYRMDKRVPYEVKVPLPQSYIEKRVPYEIKEINKVPYYGSQPGAVMKKGLYEVKPTVSKSYEVKDVPTSYRIEKRIHLQVPQSYSFEKPVPHPVKVPLPQTYTIENKVPYEVKLPVYKPYTINVPKPYPVNDEKHIPHTLENKVPINQVPIEQSYQLIVPHPVPYHVNLPTPQAYTLEEKKTPVVPAPVNKPYVYETIPTQSIQTVALPTEQSAPVHQVNTYSTSTLYHGDQAKTHFEHSTNGNEQINSERSFDTKLTHEVKNDATPLNQQQQSKWQNPWAAPTHDVKNIVPVIQQHQHKLQNTWATPTKQPETQKIEEPTPTKPMWDEATIKGLRDQTHKAWEQFKQWDEQNKKEQEAKSSEKWEQINTQKPKPKTHEWVQHSYKPSSEKRWDEPKEEPKYVEISQPKKKQSTTWEYRHPKSYVEIKQEKKNKPEKSWAEHKGWNSDTTKSLNQHDDSKWDHVKIEHANWGKQISEQPTIAEFDHQTTKEWDQNQENNGWKQDKHIENHKITQHHTEVTNWEQPKKIEHSWKPSHNIEYQPESTIETHKSWEEPRESDNNKQAPISWHQPAHIEYQQKHDKHEDREWKKHTPTWDNDEKEHRQMHKVELTKHNWQQYDNKYEKSSKLVEHSNKHETNVWKKAAPKQKEYKHPSHEVPLTKHSNPISWQQEYHHDEPEKEELSQKTHEEENTHYWKHEASTEHKWKPEEYHHEHKHLNTQSEHKPTIWKHDEPKHHNPTSYEEYHQENGKHQIKKWNGDKQDEDTTWKHEASHYEQPSNKKQHHYKHEEKSYHGTPKQDAKSYQEYKNYNVQDEKKYQPEYSYNNHNDRSEKQEETIKYHHEPSNKKQHHYKHEEKSYHDAPKQDSTSYQEYKNYNVNDEKKYQSEYTYNNHDDRSDKQEETKKYHYEPSNEKQHHYKHEEKSYHDTPKQDATSYQEYKNYNDEKKYQPEYTYDDKSDKQEETKKYHHEEKFEHYEPTQEQQEWGNPNDRIIQEYLTKQFENDKGSNGYDLKQYHDVQPIKNDEEVYDKKWDAASLKGLEDMLKAIQLTNHGLEPTNEKEFNDRIYEHELKQHDDDKHQYNADEHQYNADEHHTAKSYSHQSNGYELHQEVEHNQKEPVRLPFHELVDESPSEQPFLKSWENQHHADWVQPTHPTNKWEHKRATENHKEPTKTWKHINSEIVQQPTEKPWSNTKHWEQPASKDKKGDKKLVESSNTESETSQPKSWVHISQGSWESNYSTN